MIRANKSNDAWTKLFEKYSILENIRRNGFYKIESRQIKEFREPRLMAKWDCAAELPAILKDNNINILPIDRKSYILARFKLYQKISIDNVFKNKVTPIKFPSDFQTLKLNDITSESGAINVMLISGILDNFTNAKNNVRTFDGRMSTGSFHFQIDTFDEVPFYLSVSNAQCEIDGGFENETSVVIIEMKNSPRDDFNVRQLYYPYRLWSDKVAKPIRLLFVIFFEFTYHVFEYKFANKMNFSSIELIAQKNYSLY